MLCRAIWPLLSSCEMSKVHLMSSKLVSGKPAIK
jgi:hypothetical protein